MSAKPKLTPTHIALLAEVEKLHQRAHRASLIRPGSPEATFARYVACALFDAGVIYNEAQRVGDDLEVVRGEIERTTATLRRRPRVRGTAARANGLAEVILLDAHRRRRM